MCINSINEVIHLFHMPYCTKDMIPDRKYIPIVTICMGLQIMVMNFMEIWSYQYIGQYLVQIHWHFYVCVSEMGKKHRNTLIHHNKTKRGTRY